MQEMDDYLKEYLDYYFTRVHTSFPGVVTEYNAATRRATIQPSLKRRAGNKKFIDFPLLIDVPVQFPGTKKFTVHFPLEEGDEVAVFFSERSLEAWKDSGQDGIEDADPRCFALSDAFCTPGLQPQEFIAAVSENALEVIHKTAWDGDIIDHLVMDDDQVDFARLQETKDSFHWHLDKDKVETEYKSDEKRVFYNKVEPGKIETEFKDEDKQVFSNIIEPDGVTAVYKKDDTQAVKTTWDGDTAKIEYKDISSAVMEDASITVKFKEKAELKMEDDHIAAQTEKCAFDMAADTARIANSKFTIKLNADKCSLNNGGKSLYTVWHTLLQKLNTTAPTTFGSPATHNWNPAITQAVSLADADLTALLEA
jgi:hypothetical protein